MFFIISPAKSLNEKDAAPITSQQQPQLIAQSELLMQTLRALSPNQLQELMNISENLALLNKQRNDDWHIPFTEKNAKPAIFLFDGDVYSGIDAYRLSNAEVQYLSQHLGILSGLYGILNPLDLIQPYRLEMGTKLKNSRGADLYHWWGDLVTDTLNAMMVHNQQKTLINLASDEYFKVIQKKKLKNPIITPRFEDEKNGKFKVISFYAKKARGLMVRFAATNQLTHSEELKSFNLGGYHFTPEVSDNKTWVFRRQSDT